MIYIYLKIRHLHYLKQKSLFPKKIQLVYIYINYDQPNNHLILKLGIRLEEYMF